MNTPLQERRRQAYLLNTTPEYVTRQVGSDFWHNLEFEIGSNFQLGTQIVHPKTFIDRLQPIDPNYPLTLDPRQVCLFYVYVNPIIRSFLLQFQSENPNVAIWMLNGLLKGELDETYRNALKELWETLQGYIERFGLERGIDECLRTEVQPPKTVFRAEFEKEERYNEEMERLQVPFSEFELKKTVRVFRCAADRFRDVTHVLDMAIVSPDVPLLVTRDVHKVLKSYEYVLPVLPPDGVLVCYPRGYPKVEVKKQERQLFLSFRSTLEESEVESFLQTICRTLNLLIAELQVVPSQYSGRVVIPDVQAYSVDVWRDLIMNDEKANTLFAIDESKLSEVSSPDLHEDFDDEEPQVARLNALPHVYLPLNASFSVQIQADRLVLRFDKLDAIPTAQAIAVRMAQIVGLYSKRRRSILDEYRKYTSEPLWVPMPAVKPKKKKRDILSVFGSKYSRYCGKVPTLLSPEEAQAVQQNGFQVLQFPKPADLKAGQQPILFSCYSRTDNHIFPGLRLNPNPEGEYPLLPCCYEFDQMERANSDAFAYYRTQQRLSDFREQQKDRAFVDVDKSKPCSEMINNLYFLNGFVTPVRWGVHRTPLSALECVLYALNRNNFRTQKSEDRLRFLDAEFARLPRDFPHYASLCAQEGWNIAYPVLSSRDDYFDLRLWVRLVEEAYQCRIVMLSSEDFIFPHSIQGRWSWTRNPQHPCIVLFEHMGSTRAETYPQCEWVTFLDKDPTIQENHWIDEYAMEASGSQSLVIDQAQLQSALENAGFVLEAQHIDFYGKVYAWNVRAGSTSLTVFFRHHRAPPLHLPRATPTDVFFGKVDSFPLEIAGEFAGSQFFRLGDYEMYVYTEPQNESVRQTYEFTREQVYLMTENAKRILASRIDSSDQQNWDWIQVDPSRSYRPFNRYYFEAQERIYVPNAVTKQRLENLLRLYQRRQASELPEYAQTLVVPFEYQSLSDFQTQANAVVMTNDRVIQWSRGLYNAIHLTGNETPIRTPFLIRVRDAVYRCTLLTQFPDWVQYDLIYPQSQQIFHVGSSEPQNRVLIVTKHPQTQELTLYSGKLILSHETLP